MNKKENTVVFLFRAIAVFIGLVGILCLFGLPLFGVFVLAVDALIWYQTVRIKKAYLAKAQAAAQAAELKAEKAKREVERKAQAEARAAEAEAAAAEAARAREEKRKEMQASREATKNNPAEYERLHNMCCDIAAEYKDLLERYKDYNPTNESSALKMAGILGECYRKMDVLQTTILWHDCYNELDPFDEMEKIEKKAKTLINTYARENKDCGYIDLTSFSDSLWFIGDYIDEKEEKLNK